MLFRKERKAIEEAAETASRGINLSLVVASIAIAIAAIALFVGVMRNA
jgi:hypothetical protein